MDNVSQIELRVVNERMGYGEEDRGIDVDIITFSSHCRPDSFVGFRVRMSVNGAEIAE